MKNFIARNATPFCSGIVFTVVVSFLEDRRQNRARRNASGVQEHLMHLRTN